MDSGWPRWMKAVVDTNVVAYHLLGTPGFAEEAGRFLRRAGELVAPAVWEAQFANVVWMAARAGRLSETEALRKLRLAARLGIRSVASRTLWQGGVVRALRSGVGVYDTLFAELADRENAPLATFDQRLLVAYPLLAKRPGDIRHSRR